MGENTIVAEISMGLVGLERLPFKLIPARHAVFGTVDGCPSGRCEVLGAPGRGRAGGRGGVWR